jgi:hypothetical protein
VNFRPALLFWPLIFLAACKPPAPPLIKAAPPPVVQIIHAEKGGISRSITLPARVRAWHPGATCR